jgi:hypothetical protein
MQSAVEADLNQLKVVFALHARMNPAVETGEILKEISARLREELDYDLEARHTALYGLIFKDEPSIRVPRVLPELSTKRLLTMTWLEGRRLMDYKGAPLEHRNAIARAMFRAWWFPVLALRRDPRRSPSRQLHDLRDDGGQRHGGGDQHGAGHAGRDQPPRLRLHPHLPDPVRAGRDRSLQWFVARQARSRRARLRDLGFAGLSTELIDTLNIWARFIYGPLLDDREREIADGTTPGQYGRKEAFTVHKALKEKGPVRVPREFVFMDRAAIGLGGVFLHLGARLNWHNMFNDTIRGFTLDEVGARQKTAFAAVGVPLPTAS